MSGVVRNGCSSFYYCWFISIVIAQHTFPRRLFSTSILYLQLPTTIVYSILVTPEETLTSYLCLLLLPVTAGILLDRHFVCRSHDPCLGLMPTFVKKRPSSLLFSFRIFFLLRLLYVSFFSDYLMSALVSWRQLVSVYCWILCFLF